MKKILAIILALTICISACCVTAFADEPYVIEITVPELEEGDSLMGFATILNGAEYTIITGKYIEEYGVPYYLEEAEEAAEEAEYYTEKAERYTEYFEQYTQLAEEAAANGDDELAQEYYEEAEYYAEEAKYYTDEAEYYAEEAEYYTEYAQAIGELPAVTNILYRDTTTYDFCLSGDVAKACITYDGLIVIEIADTVDVDSVTVNGEEVYFDVDPAEAGYNWYYVEYDVEIPNPYYQLVNYDLPRHATNEYGDVFLGGKYIEVGVSESGSFGTDGGIDASYGFHGGRTSEGSSSSPIEPVGLVSDADGWEQGEESKIGDVFLPGTEEERWIVAYELDGDTYTHIGADRVRYTTDDFESISTVDNSNACSRYDLCAKTTAVTTDGVTIIIETHFNVEDAFYTTDATIINNTDKELTNARFIRSFDPDQDLWLNDTFDTYNKVICNPDSSVEGSEENCAMVVARGEESLEGIFFLSIDNRARASWRNGLSPDSAYDSDLWIEEGEWANAPTDALIEMTHAETNGYELEDGGIAITVNFGTIAAGASDTTTIYTSLDGDVLDSLNKILAGLKNIEASKTTIVADAEKGYYYQLADKNGNPVSGWVLPQEGKVTFDGLTEGTSYTVLAVAIEDYNNGEPDDANIVDVGVVKTSGEAKNTVNVGWFCTGDKYHAMMIGRAIITLPHEFTDNGDCKYCGYNKDTDTLTVSNSYESTEEETENVEAPEDTEEPNPATGCGFALIPLTLAICTVIANKRR